MKLGRGDLKPLHATFTLAREPESGVPCGINSRCAEVACLSIGRSPLLRLVEKVEGW